MSEQELNNYENVLSNALKESYEKMLRLKMKMGQEVVLGDEEGNPIIVSAEEAWERHKNRSSFSRISDK